MSSLITVRYSSKHILTCYCTTDLHKLVNAAVTTKILSIVVTLMSVGFLIKLIGRGPARIVHFFLSSSIILPT